MFASESDLTLRRAEKPPLEMTLFLELAGEGWQRSPSLHGAAPLAARFPLSFWHQVIFSFMKQL